ncbi:cGMP-dependent protein kinase 2, partial [Goodea atripinnis]
EMAPPPPWYPLNMEGINSRSARHQEKQGKFCFDRTFDHTVGNFNELQKHLEGYVATLDRDDKKRHAKKSVSRHQSQPLSPDFIQLKEIVSIFSSSRPFDHLEVIATLGVGGFGRVELVRYELI